MGNEEDGQRADEGEWEYREITIPLNLREGLTDKKVRPQVDRIIAARLEEERREGWEPDEAVDLSSLRTGERVQFRFHWFAGPTYVSVAIRLKRAVSSE